MISTRSHGLKLCLAFFVSFLLITTYYVYSTQLELDHALLEAGSYDLCSAFPNPGNIVIVLKTGATASQARLPKTLSTSLRCHADPIIVSDLEQRLGDHHIYDVLANVTPSIKESSKDFHLYYLQQDFVRAGRESEIPLLSVLPHPGDDWKSGKHNAGWSLDKWKFLYEVQFAWDMVPEQAWYFFIEGDTYLSWSNFMRWLPHLDPRKKLYLGGSQHLLYRSDNFWWANGGAGILLSGATVREFAVEKRGLPQRWDERLTHEAIGDLTLATALDEELGLRVTDAWPTQCFEEPSNMPFRADFWCRPIVTLHHMKPDTQQKVYDFELKNPNRPMLYADMFFLERFEDNIVPVRHEWDNSADNVHYVLSAVQTKGSDRESCAQACEQDGRCLEYKFVIESDADTNTVTNTQCHLSSTYRHGHASPRRFDTRIGGNRNFTSGYMVDRIQTMARELGTCEGQELIWPGLGKT